MTKRMSQRSERERISELQQRLGNPATGTYIKQDHDLIRMLPRFNRDLIERYYGVRGHGVETAQSMSRAMGLPDAMVIQTINESFVLIAGIRELESQRDQWHRRWRNKRAGMLTDTDRVQLRQARQAISAVLESDKSEDRDSV